MLSRNTVSTGLVFLSLAAGTFAQDNRSGLGHFTREAFPAIACVAGFFILAYALYYSHVKAGPAGWRNHALWFIFDLLLALWGFFLIFGPDNISSSSGGSNFNSPRAAIIGLQLIIQAAIGVFAVYAANAYASLAFAMLGMFNLLCLIGSNYLFNYNQPIWTLDQTQCNQYFASSDIQRCRDDGYLQFLRVIGMFAIFTEGYLILVSLLAYATAVPAYAAGHHHAAAGGVPATTYGAPAATSTYSTGYSQPAVATGGYKTEGPVPAGSTTTTVV